VSMEQQEWDGSIGWPSRRFQEGARIGARPAQRLQVNAPFRQPENWEQDRDNALELVHHRSDDEAPIVVQLEWKTFTR